MDTQNQNNMYIIESETPKPSSSPQQLCTPRHRLGQQGRCGYYRCCCPTQYTGRWCMGLSATHLRNDGPRHHKSGRHSHWRTAPHPVPAVFMAFIIMDLYGYAYYVTPDKINSPDKLRPFFVYCVSNNSPWDFKEVLIIQIVMKQNVWWKHLKC